MNFKIQYFLKLQSRNLEFLNSSNGLLHFHFVEKDTTRWSFPYQVSELLIALLTGRSKIKEDKISGQTRMQLVWYTLMEFINELFAQDSLK